MKENTKGKKTKQAKQKGSNKLSLKQVLPALSIAPLILCAVIISTFLVKSIGFPLIYISVLKFSFSFLFFDFLRFLEIFDNEELLFGLNGGISRFEVLL